MSSDRTGDKVDGTEATGTDPHRTSGGMVRMILLRGDLDTILLPLPPLLPHLPLLPLLPTVLHQSCLVSTLTQRKIGTSGFCQDTITVIH